MVAANSEQIAKQRVMVMQIITAALCLGVISFMAIAILITDPGEKKPNAVENSTIIMIVAAVLIAGTLTARAIVPRIIVAQTRRRMIDREPVAASSEDIPPTDGTDTNRLYDVLLTKTILEGAFLEGPSFFCLVMYIISHNWLPLAVAVAAVAWMLIEFPTRSQSAAWVQTQLEIIDAERTFSNPNPNQP